MTIGYRRQAPAMQPGQQKIARFCVSVSKAEFVCLSRICSYRQNREALNHDE
jgi:hypothetical protein